ncbi:MAG: molybdopterin-dependent oxidoreductase [Eubacteriales bacterium]|nr:molybdopterin-dependent oxidoreductase [Eubacteriales bacterium]
MEKIKMVIDGKECFGLPGQTILDVAKTNNIFIPTLCFDERVEIYGACGICVVEVEGNPKMVKACATIIAPDMVVKTNTERVFESRKTNLELLLSNHVGDCRPPCALNCPAGTDCQGYVGLIANGQFGQSEQLIKERIPLPGCIGRVCPHPCEDNCRRKLIDEPISIAWLKRFAADMMRANPYIPEIEPETGKKIAVIGGGPYGLSAAYYLRQKGHAITIYEAMPGFGGMLRYGIPQYRLPKEIIDEEVAQIEKMGVVLKPDTQIGKDISFETIRKEYDAVILGIGAWVSTGVGCPGEDAEGVIGGIDFLRKVIKKEKMDLGDVVAIVGGGNTAMDACRTAIRMGKKVYNIYRRTKDEMPADMIEIVEAEEEGVIFKNLTNPLEIITDEEGHVKQIKLQIMELGEPDASGRRAPKPVEGKTETLDVDNVILAIGQAVNSSGFENIDLTRKKGIVYDKDTFMTSMEGVFAGGDCGNDKISIAIEAIADGGKVADIVDAYLAGKKSGYKKPYVVERDDVTEKTFEDREKQCRPKMSMLEAMDRKDNFNEVVDGFTPEQAIEEGKRCLECGCGKYYECKLYDYANQYGVQPERLSGDVNRLEFEDDHPYVMRDPNKCILCGLCVRVCDEVMGATALGLVKRGFDTTVQPALENPLEESGCISCGNCISVCPVGALLPKVTHTKPIPLKTKPVRTICTECGVGCQIDLKVSGTKVVGVEPAFGPSNGGLLCIKGKFGYAKLYSENRLTTPLIRKDGKLVEATWEEAVDLITLKLNEIKAGSDPQSFAAFAGHTVSNEAKFMLNKLIKTVSGTEPAWKDTAFYPDDSSDQAKAVDAICRAVKHHQKGVNILTSLKSFQVLDALKTGKAKILYLMGENPLDPEKKIEGVEDALKKCEFLVVQDISLNDTAKLADVVLPAAGFAESDGTFTNMEGRVQRIRKAVQAPGVSLADSKILGMILTRMGCDMGFRSAEDVFEELRKENPAYGYISYEALEQDGSALIK